MSKAPARGESWKDAHGEVRVVVIAEGYVVARRKGAAPFLKSIREFTSNFDIVPPQKSDATL